MTYDTDMDIIALSPFEPNAMFATTEDSDTIRRFTTLLDCGAVGGGSHHLRKVANTEGETFALKTLLPLSGCDENGSAISPSGIKTLTEEYRNLAAVSLLGGFPKTMATAIPAPYRPSLWSGLKACPFAMLRQS